VSTGPKVLFVSKAVVPPWNDGSKNLVRDIAANLAHARPTVMTTADADSIGPNVTNEAIYQGKSRFSPALTENARVLSRLLQKDTHDAWAFAFAPNPRTSFVARGAIMAARARGFRGKIVQIVASSPRDFTGVSRLLFGDVVIALSEFTRGRLLGAGVTRDVRVIPPCARPLRVPSLEEIRRVREYYKLGDGPVILYPGDYEVSTGAGTVAAAVRHIKSMSPDARVLFACREKTPRSVETRAKLEAELILAGLSDMTRHEGNVPDMAPLVHAADIIAFPVDDLYGKVDIPLVLLEAMAARKPIIVCRGGPLGMLNHAPAVEPEDADALADEIRKLLESPMLAAHIGQRGEDLYHARFSPRIIAGAYDSLFAEICERG